MPWNELYTTSNGTYGLCCLEDQNSNQSRIPLSTEVAQHWNSDYMRSVRRAFIEGQELSQCNHCWQDEASGKVSGRMRRNQQYYQQPDISIGDDVIADTLAKTDTNGHTDMPVKGLFFSVGNLCQLRCIDCSPSYSRSILKDYKKLGWDANTKNRRVILDQDLLHNEQQLNQSLWQRVQEIGSQVEYIKIQGGEPTISRPLLDFLRWYDDQGYAEKCMIFITTNAVNVKPEFINALKKFRYVKFEISVDGVGAVDEYVRYPTNWKKKEAIIDMLIKEFPSSLIHSAIYSLNLGNLPELIQWAETKPVLHSIQSVTYPDELGIQHLPNEYKDQIIKSLEPWASNETIAITDNYDRVGFRNNCVNGVINRLKRAGDPDQWARAKSIIQSYDTIRNHRLTEIIPSLAPYINK